MKEAPQWLSLRMPRHRSVRLALAGVLAGLALLLAVNAAGRWAAAPAPPGPAPRPGDDPAADALATLEADLARELERTLGGVRGAGRVRVQVALTGGVEREFALDRVRNRTTTEERDRSGGTRQVTQEDDQARVVTAPAGTGQQPLVRRVVRPEVRGVLVVAEGARDSAVKDALARAAQAALGVPLHRVTVVPGEDARGGGEVR